MIGLCQSHRRKTLAAVCVMVFLSPAFSEAQQKDKAPPTPAYRPTGKTLDAAALARFVDDAIEQKLRTEKIDVSLRSDDAEFIRRVTLDLTGHIPTADAVTAFLDNTDPQKRAMLIDTLLAGEQYAKHQADIWQALLLPPRSSDNRQLNSAPLVKWLEESFSANKPWDRLVTEILTASGTQDKNGATTYFIAQSSADKITDNVSRVFLGVQLQCAQCHNHPFTEWKQTEYWGMAAFFLNVQATRPQGNAQQAAPAEVKEAAGPRRGRGGLPESAKIVPAKFLGGEQAKIGASDPRRPVLASWLTTRDNPYFARAMVNRTWAQLFGRGLVHPIDDIKDENPSLYPEVLGELSYQFAQNGYDLKYLLRALCNSAAYQRSSKPAGNNADASPALFSRMAIKVMSPEQLFDSLTLVVGDLNGGGDNRPRPGVAMMGRGQGNARTQFVAFFSGEDGSDPTEYQGGIPQALRLMNGRALSNPARINDIAKAGKTPEGTVERLFLMTLSRRPTAKEVERYTTYISKQANANQGYADVLWALLNSSAFAMNH